MFGRLGVSSIGYVRGFNSWFVLVLGSWLFSGLMVIVSSPCTMPDEPRLRGVSADKDCHRSAVDCSSPAHVVFSLVGDGNRAGDSCLKCCSVRSSLWVAVVVCRNGNMFSSKRTCLETVILHPCTCSLCVLKSIR